MSSNKVEYSIYAGPYCMTHDFKVPFCMPKFSGSKITVNRFHVDNIEGESGVGYDMITGHDLIVLQGTMKKFKPQVLQ